MSSRTPKPMTRVAPGGQGPSEETTGEREMFRLRTPVVIFYIWLAFAAFNVVDLALQAKPRFALEVSLVVLIITGVAYACGLRPRVIADDRGLTVINPIREWHLPWSSLRAVDVRDWVRFTCAGRSRPVESWALFATARVKRNYREWAHTYVSRNPTIQRYSDETQQLMSQPEVVIIANRIEARLRATEAAAQRTQKAAAKAGEAPPANESGVTARWAWLSIAAVLLPALALVVILLAG
jgi:hypothetical protein